MLLGVFAYVRCKASLNIVYAALMAVTQCCCEAVTIVLLLYCGAACYGIQVMILLSFKLYSYGLPGHMHMHICIYILSTVLINLLAICFSIIELKRVI
jgi:hypothetical protein